MKRGSLLVVGLSVLAVLLASCVGVDAHEPGGGVEPEPCEVTIVSVNAGAERVPSPVRSSPVLTSSIPDVTIVWHCGTPDEPPPIIADATLSVRPYTPRAPPRG